MGFFSRFFGRNPLNTIRFRGQGYAEEGALHHAEQRFQAWKREFEMKDKSVQILKKDISYLKKNELVHICYIDCSYLVNKK